MWESARNFPAELTSPGDARRFCADELRSVLGGDSRISNIVDTVVIIVSELVTNAVRVATEPVALRLLLNAGVLRIEVYDDAAGTPRQQQTDLDDPSGRGLPIVAALSAEWGVTSRSGGKCVWALVPVEAPSGR